ncbi:hypothetical protein ACTXPV_00145 [Corynebacterium glyciniphilum]
MDRDTWGRGGGQQSPSEYQPQNPYHRPQESVPSSGTAEPRSGLVVSVVIAVLAVLIAVGTAGLWLLNRDTEAPRAEAPGASSAETLDDYLVDGQDGPAAEDVAPDDGLPPGLGYTGYFDNENAVCDGFDTWVYAGEGGGAAVVVCVSDVDDTLYMRGDFTTGVARGDVAMDDEVDVVDGIYTVGVDGGIVEFFGTELWFTDGDGADPLAQFDDFWYDDTVWGP